MKTGLELIPDPEIDGVKVASGVAVEEMIAIAAENPAGHFLMGRALQTGGRPRRALVHYRSALAIDPDHEGARKAVERIEDGLAGSSAGIPRVERASPP